MEIDTTYPVFVAFPTWYYKYKVYLMMSSPYGRVQIFQVKSSEAVAQIDFLGCIARAEIDIMWPLNVLLRTAFLYGWVSYGTPA